MYEITAIMCAVDRGTGGSVKVSSNVDIAVVVEVSTVFCRLCSL